MMTFVDMLRLPGTVPLRLSAWGEPRHIESVEAVHQFIMEGNDVEAVLVHVAKAKDLRYKRWWRLRKGETFEYTCNVCSTVVLSGQRSGFRDANERIAGLLETHIEEHVEAAQAMIDDQVWPVSLSEFTRWSSILSMKPPHETYFDLPCVTYAVYRLVRLHGMVEAATIRHALQRVATDPSFKDAVEAAAYVPSGITTLLANQGL